MTTVEEDYENGSRNQRPVILTRLAIMYQRRSYSQYYVAREFHLGRDGDTEWFYYFTKLAAKDSSRAREYLFGLIGDGSPEEQSDGSQEHDQETGVGAH